MNKPFASRVVRLYVTIWLASVAGSLAVAILAHQGLAGASLFVFSTLTTSFMSWVQLRSDQDAAAESWDSAAATEALAKELLHHWEKKKSQRTFNVQAPLRVSWDAVDGDAIDDWTQPMAGSAPGPNGPTPQQAESTSYTNALDSAVAELRELISRVRTRRLVILGEGGTGKTSLLVHLVLRLLQDRVPGDPVPVLISLASWNQSSQSLFAWVESTLVNDFKCPALPRPSAIGSEEASALQVLFREHRLFLILDGLDEMLPEFRRGAIADVNDLDLDDKIVISSRVDEYLGQVVSRANPVQNAAGIVLRTLDTTDIKDYLCLRAGNVGGRWNPVFAALSTPGPVAEALSTPLMVNLARTIYNPDRPERGRSSREPAELVNLPDVDAIERHLFQNFIATAYRKSDTSVPARWEVDDARRWLEFLARHQEAQLDNKIDFDWWELANAAEVPKPLVGIVVGVLSALATGSAARFGSHVHSGFGLGLGAGIALALLIGLPIHLRRRSRQRPLIGLSWGLAGALLGGLAAGVAGMFGIGYAPGLFGGLAGGLGVGVGAGPACGRLGGFFGGMAGGFLAGTLVGVGSGWPAGIVNGLGVGLGAGLIATVAARPKPANAVKWSRIGILGGLAAGIAVGLGGWLVSGPDVGLLAGLGSALAAALASGLARRPAHVEEIGVPSLLLSRDRRAFLLAGVSVFCTVGPVTAMLVAISAAHELHARLTYGFLLANGLATGISVGFVCGLVLAFVQAAWGSFAVARYWLAAKRHLPLHLSAFLSDAHERRDILRQIGARYQFRHRELQRYLADEAKERPQAGQRTVNEEAPRIKTKDFLLAPTTVHPYTYRMVQPSGSDVRQLYPYIDLTYRMSGGDASRQRPAELCARWYERCPESFMHLEKFVDGHWRPIAVSIILPLSRNGYRAIVPPHHGNGAAVAELDVDDIVHQFGAGRRFPLAGPNRFLLIDTWTVDQGYRRSGHGKSDVGGGYANTLLLRHVSIFWNAASGFRQTTFLAATNDLKVAHVLESMTFKSVSRSENVGGFYETDTATLESDDDVKLTQIQSVIKAVEGRGVELTVGTALQPSDWAGRTTSSAT